MTLVHFPLEKVVVASLHVSVTQSLLYSRPGGHETSDEVACPAPDPQNQQDWQSWASKRKANLMPRETDPQQCTPYLLSLGRSESSDLLILVIRAVLLQEVCVTRQEHSPARCAGPSSPTTSIRDAFRHQDQPFRISTCSRVIKHDGDSSDKMSIQSFKNPFALPLAERVYPDKCVRYIWVQSENEVSI